MGQIHHSGTIATFFVSKREHIAEILENFYNYSLNTKKHLDFSDFKRAFKLYISSRSKTELIKDIEIIKSGMNRYRTNFDMPADHEYKITPYWLLGFVEGDGSFYIAKKGYRLIFSICQSSIDSVILYKIREFLFDLPYVNRQTMQITNIRITEYKGSSINSMAKLDIDLVDILKFVNIPFFNSMT